MQTVPLLLDWGWPVISKPRELNHNCKSVIDYFRMFEEDFYFIGTGNSGAMIIGAMTSINRECFRPYDLPFEFTVFPKIGVNSTTFKQPRLKDKQLIIIDDHLHSGRTLLAIKGALQEQSQIFGHDFTNQVVAVVANEWDKELPEDSIDRVKSLHNGSLIIEGLFPSCQTWIH